LLNPDTIYPSNPKCIVEIYRPSLNEEGVSEESGNLQLEAK